LHDYILKAHFLTSSSSSSLQYSQNTQYNVKKQVNTKRQREIFRRHSHGKGREEEEEI